MGKRLTRTRRYLIGAAGAVILYALFAYPCYTRLQVAKVKEACHKIMYMNLDALDEEDEEVLQGYQVDKLEFLITDDEFGLIYATKKWDAKRQIRIYIRDRLEEFGEKMSVTVRKNQKMRIIHLREVTEQNGQKYYVHIRKEMHAAGETVFYSAIYFGAVWILFCAAVYLQKRRERGSEQLQEMEGGSLERAEKEFVANVSHELKTPLAVISGQVEMLQKMGDEIDRDYYFASIREEIDKMSEMVGNLLDITIMEHNMEEMELCRVNLTDMMEYLILKYDALFEKNRIRLQTQIADGCYVRANHMYLEQAISNYIMNAFQHTAQGKKMAIRLKVDNKDACILVYNEGEQIAKSDMERIWQSFYMKSRKENREQKMSNAGLGLYLVKKIVEQHQGECGVQNQADGVEFWIRLSLDKDQSFTCKS